MDVSEQLFLFDTGPDLRHLKGIANRLSECSQSLNTRISYASAWRRFEKWCKSVGRQSLPCDPDTVSLHLVSLLESGRKTNTVQMRFNGIRHYHRAAGYPDVFGGVKAMLSGARRVYQHTPACKLALTVEQLDQISTIWSTQERVGLVAQRNRAVIVFGFASAMRRSELAALNLADVAVVPSGVIVNIATSKTDQESKGYQIGVSYGRRPNICPVQILKAWLILRGAWAGPLFPQLNWFGLVTDKRMKADRIAKIVKEGVQLIGLDPAGYGAHSLRAGCVTAAVESGASHIAIMQRTGHRSVATVLRYVRPASLFSMDPLSGAL